jgi:hypothetical protein
MKANEIQRLIYRRQYLMAPRAVECPFMNVAHTINEKYILYAHADLPITEYVKDQIRLVLLGDIFDYESINKNNQDILADLFDNDFLSLLEKSNKYTGRYVLIYSGSDGILMAHDATATRKIYYSRTDEEIWCSSQPHLLAKILDCKNTGDISKQAFYNSKVFQRLNNSNIGDTTYFDEINQVLPNHYLQFSGCKSIRYWPDKKIDRIPLKVAAKECSKMIKGFMESISNRYDIMLPVTAGYDSRLLLAGTRDIQNKVYYYINKDKPLHEDNPDMAIPKALLKKLNLEFHILDPYIAIDKDFEKAFLNNNRYASRFFLHHIYNYYLNFQNKVNLPGNIASHPFWKDKFFKKHITVQYLAFINGVEQYEFARKKYKEWLSESYDICMQSRIRIVNLFYWEERLGNWGTQIQMEKDIAQEEFNPFNSRKLMCLYFSVKQDYNQIPDLQMHREIIKNLWPELLDFPFNPSLKHAMLSGLKKLGLLNFYNALKSNLTYSLYLTKYIFKNH